MTSLVTIKKTTEFGPILVCKDDVIFDLLEDFLTEDCDKDFSVKFNGKISEIYFESDESVESLERILEKFDLKQKF